MRIEQDFLGSVEIPDDALYGVHAQRARENFPSHRRFSGEWYRAVGVVKKACYETIAKMQGALREKYPETPLPFAAISDSVLSALLSAADEIATGRHFEHFIVPGVTGGAGTSINMNVNEIIANRALQLLGESPGRYDIIDPVEQANLFQSTNDVIPTALKVAVLSLLDTLAQRIDHLRMGIERKETAYRDVLRVAYTQLQRAVPSSYGKLFSTYQESLSRDWWRVSRCFERIKTINLGGSAVGTGITVPKYFIFEVVETLRHATGKPLTRGDNLQDTTANLDSLVEVHGILKAHAVNLEKMAADFRLLGSDVFSDRVLHLPARQVGSSIMPGKVNPVISEYVISVAHEVYASDILIAALSAQGMLDLNAYLPVIGDHLISTLKHLISANDTMLRNLVTGVTLDETRSEEILLGTPAIATALLPHIGYHEAERLANRMRDAGENIVEANNEMKSIAPEKLSQLLSPHSLLQLGYKISDIIGKDPADGGGEDA